MKPKTKAGKQAKVGKVMHEFKTGTLHSGKGGPEVTSVSRRRVKTLLTNCKYVVAIIINIKPLVSSQAQRCI